MRRDRDDYRAMSTTELLAAARDFGIDSEMAITLAEKLHDRVHWSLAGRGAYHFNHEGAKTP